MDDDGVLVEDAQLLQVNELTDACYFAIDFPFPGGISGVQMQGHAGAARAGVCGLQQLRRGGADAVNEDKAAHERFGIAVAVKLRVELAQRPHAVDGDAGGQAVAFQAGHGGERFAPVPQIGRGEERAHADALDGLGRGVGRKDRARLDEHGKAAGQHLDRGHGGRRGLVLGSDVRLPVGELDDRRVDVENVAENAAAGCMHDVVVGVDKAGVHDAALCVDRLPRIEAAPQLGVRPDGEDARSGNCQRAGRNNPAFRIHGEHLTVLDQEVALAPGHCARPRAPVSTSAAAGRFGSDRVESWRRIRPGSLPLSNSTYPA